MSNREQLLKELNEVYLPIQKSHGLMKYTHENQSEAYIKIYKGKKLILKQEGEEMEVVIENTIRELQFLDKHGWIH